MIYILHTAIDEKNHKNLIDYYLPKFSIEFQNKIKRYSRWQDAQLSLLGRVLLLKGLKLMNCNDVLDIKYTPFNKPYFDRCDVRFNISHAGKIVVCCLTYLGDIGIDIEKIEPIHIFDFKSQMTHNEWGLLNDSQDVCTSFFTYWTQKEAVIKAYGKGLTIPLKSFEVILNRTCIGCAHFFLKK